jgi:hypothetical protein
MQLRNCILIALAMDATPQEVEHAHDIIDRVYGPTGNAGVDPAYLLSTPIPATDNGVTAHGQAVTVHNTTTVAAPEVDSRGVPWDERIHSSSKENRKNADGSWRSRRGVDVGFKAKLEEQLKAGLNATVPTSAAPMPTPAAAAAPPALPGANLPPMPGAAAPVETPYTELVKFIAANTKSAANPAGVFDDEYIGKVLAHYGVPDGSLPNLAHTPQLVQPIHDWLKSVLAG